MCYRCKCELLTAATPALLKVAIDAFLAGTSTNINCKWTNNAGTQCLLFYDKYYNESFVNPILVVTWDNSAISQFTTVFPIFVAQGCAGTFYITSAFIGTAGCMTWANLLTMQAAGMDIQCHTHTHTDLLTLTNAQIIAEYTNVNNAFIGAGMAAPQHTAYPNGSQDARVREVTAIMRLTGRNYDVFASNTAYRYPQFKDLRKFNIMDWCIDNSSMASVDLVLFQMQAALVHKSAVIFHGHSCGGVGETQIADLNTIIDYAQANGFQILTIAQLYALLLA